MKRITTILLFSLLLQCCSSEELSAQQVYFGIPDNDRVLVPGSTIITNLPIHSSGRFIPSESLDSLVTFLKDQKILNIKIEINYFHFPPAPSQRYSNKLANHLHDLLKLRTNDIWEVKSNGSENPIFLNKDSKKYKFINTRLDIYILNKDGVNSTEE